MSVDLTFRGGAAVLTIDNAPLNLLSAEVRAGLRRSLDAAVAQGATRLIVTGAGKTFVAGADAREFGLPPIPPHLNDVLLHLSQLAIPTIAAINGAALGGGLEIALACRYRIAAPGAQLGLPEVVLGIVPGAGGTQRLPRLIGVRTALDLIVNGKAIAADKALSLELVDQLAGDPVAAALALDAAVLSAAQGPDERPAPQVDDDAVAAMLTHAKRRLPGQIAPPIAVGLVAASATLPLAEGLARERAAFVDLRASAQARALRHVFFAERAAGNRGRGYPRPARDIATAIVVGGGNMGASIAYALATAGIAVTIVERDAAAADRATGNLHRLVDQGVIPPSACRRIARIRASVYLLVFIQNLLVHLAEKILLMQPLTFGGDYRYFGIATYLTLPTGDYSSTEPSLGTNRWSMAIQPAFLFNVAPNWSVDLVGDVTIYGDNDDGLGGATVEKDPSFTALGWVNYHASEKTTVSIGATTSWGGAETVGGIQGVDVKSTTVRAAWSQLLTPTSQFMMEVGHDVEAENTFERDTTVTLRLAKFF